MYKFFKKGTYGSYNDMIVRIIDNAWIPLDISNTDYQEYLKWVEEGNIAEDWNPEGI